MLVRFVDSEQTGGPERKRNLLVTGIARNSTVRHHQLRTVHISDVFKLCVDLSSDLSIQIAR